MSATRTPGRGTADHDGPHEGTDRLLLLEEEVAHLQQAVQSQRRIGTAIGLIAQRFLCSTEQAWHLLSRVSQDSNTKVREAARVLVTAHDEEPGPDDRLVLETLLAHLPRTGWPTVDGHRATMTTEDP